MFFSYTHKGSEKKIKRPIVLSILVRCALATRLENFEQFIVLVGCPSDKKVRGWWIFVRRHFSKETNTDLETRVGTNTDFKRDKILSC